MEKENNVEKKRIFYMDFLKCIGLIAIVLAHVGAPEKIMMLRGFDVPLMVILSAVLAHKSFDRHKQKGLSALKYCFERVKRLVIPTWIFLLFYFAFTALVDGEVKGWQFYLLSFGLTLFGLGFVWVILVYVYSALLIPVFAKIRLSKAVVCCIAIVYFLYELACYYHVGVDNKILYSTVFYVIPYGLLTFLGYHFFSFGKRTRYCIILVSFLVFISLGIYYWDVYGYIQSVQYAKYPPRMYYLSYGICAAFIMLLLAEWLDLKIFRWRGFRYISEHSLWIYLWHILWIYIYEKTVLPANWVCKLVFVLGMSVLTVVIVNKGLDMLGKDKLSFVKYLRG